MIKNRNKIFFVIVFSILLINVCSAYGIYVRPLSAGSLQPDTTFIYTFNFSVDSACANIVLSRSDSITTDDYGIGFLEIDISNMSAVPSYLCEYKSGTLRAVHTLSDQIFGTVYVKDINATGIVCDSNGCIEAVDHTWNYNQTIPANEYTDATNSSMTSWIDTIFLKIADMFSMSQIVNMILGNKTEILANNATWSTTYNATYDTGIKSVFVNYTNVKTTGNISNGSLVGYAAGTAICNYEIYGSHMCMMDEVLEAQNNNNYANFTATFRVSEGAPGYTAEAADCGGWKDGSTSSLGAIWVGNNINGGSGALVSCSAERAIGCCK